MVKLTLRVERDSSNAVAGSHRTDDASFCIASERHLQDPCQLRLTKGNVRTSEGDSGKKKEQERGREGTKKEKGSKDGR